jgi:hypothetical protein
MTHFVAAAVAFVQEEAFSDQRSAFSKNNRRNAPDHGKIPSVAAREGLRRQMFPVLIADVMRCEC